MRYFLLEQDKDESHYPLLKNWYSKVNPRYIKPDMAHKLPRRQIVDIEAGMFTVFTDVVLAPFLLVSETVRDVIDCYEPKLEYKEIIVLDREYSKTALYFLPILAHVDCLADGTEFNLNKSMLRRAVIDPAAAQGRSVFRIGGVLDQYIAVRLDLLESILRRETKGVGASVLECVPNDKGVEQPCREKNFWSGARR